MKRNVLITVLGLIIIRYLLPSTIMFAETIDSSITQRTSEDSNSFLKLDEPYFTETEHAVNQSTDESQGIIDLPASSSGNDNSDGESSGSYDEGEEDKSIQKSEYNHLSSEDVLTAEAAPQMIGLGGKFAEERLKDLVTNVRLNGDELKREEFKVILSNQPNTSHLGNQQVQITVVHLETQIATQVHVPVEVIWGHSIFSREASRDASTGVISLHIGDTGPSLVASEGFGNAWGNQVTSRPSFSIYHKKYSSRTPIPFFTVNQSRTSVIQAWNNALNNIEIEFGDVIGLSVNRFAIANQNYNGANTWITRNEEPVRETIGWPEALYMMTESGFQLLRVNQLTTNKLTFDAGDSSNEIVQRMNEFFNFHQEFSNQEKEEFEFDLLSHDVMIPGEDGKAVVQVTQKKENGYSFSMEYEVLFTVNSGQLELTEIAHGDFDFGNVLKSSRRQEIPAQGEIAPTIMINDYSDVAQWSIYVSMSPFINEWDQELSEVSITLKNLKVIESVHENIFISASDISLGQIPQLIASRSVSKEPKDEYGKTVIQIGEVENYTLTGVSLIFPNNVLVDAGDYQTTITWELVGDPTMGGSR
ncbi:WxL domain-containing protein [Enterococcus casseliflavus]|uniref:WxL domain-containing protein n=1 Tax=Enterococcus casseliflavus TaxID=37734 RepID=UPI002DBD98D0|nr:WxL domain-containing protein [Enterococcus casseliflavus]MEB6088084.1 WxL domain-containing protein [Enterococcus casseliflavus]